VRTTRACGLMITWSCALDADLFGGEKFLDHHD
jgi:hypothetical protein